MNTSTSFLSAVSASTLGDSAQFSPVVVRAIGSGHKLDERTTHFAPSIFHLRRPVTSYVGHGIPGGSARYRTHPHEIGAGKRVFVSNMGGECQDFTSPGLFGAGQPLHHGQVSAAVPTAYDGMYSALSVWRRFELVNAPADADLIFQIRVVCPSIQEGHPVLELQILDPKTRVALWGFNEIADPAERQKHRDANFERALSRLIQDVKDLLVRADSAPVSATK